LEKYEKEILQSQLDMEKALLKKLEQNYKDSLEEINDRIAMLLGRSDADLQHVIFQVQYQKALKKQIQAILETLQNNEFESLSEYLTECYKEGFVGGLYELQKQGVPLIMPISQEQVIAAIQHETNLTSDLYTELGLDIKDLQKKIAGEISRGISTGMMFSEIARNISGYARIPKNRAMTIARTEGHRITEKANSDMQHIAQSRGADMVKVWSSAWDGKTRPSHRKMDGEIKELDEPYSNGLMYPGDPDGKPEEVINCRCRSRSKARWLLEADETKILGDTSKMTDEQLKDIADKLHLSVDELIQYSGQIIPVKAKDYNDFKRQYDQLWHYEGSDLQKEAEERIASYKGNGAERVRSNAPKIKDSNKQRTLEETTKITRKKQSSDYGVVDREIVNSKKYHDKYENLTKHKEVNESIYQETMKMLEHRDGTGFEDMVAIDARTGKIVVDVTDSTDIGKLTLTQNQYDKIVNHASDIVLVHNHPNGSRPSYTDILKLKEKNISAVVAAGHDGSVYVVSNLKNDFDIEIFWEEAYNTYKQIYQDDILAERHATDDLYKLGVFDVERR